MKYVLGIFIITLTGCGSVDSVINSGDTDYITLSYSKAGGMYKIITGETEACKLTKHGITGLNYDLELDENGCRISAAK